MTSLTEALLPGKTPTWSGVDTQVAANVTPNGTTLIATALNLVGTAVSNADSTTQASVMTGSPNLIPFLPAQTANFTFQPTLDGTPYKAVITWNLYGQRYYLNLYDLQGTRIFTVPLIASPDWYNISLTAGYFTTTIIYRSSTGNIEIGTTTPPGVFPPRVYNPNVTSPIYVLGAGTGKYLTVDSIGTGLGAG